MDAGGSTNVKDEARRLLGAGQVQEAIDLLQASGDENDAEAQSLLGAALGMSGDTAGSIAHLERATQIDPRQPTYQFNLGCALEKAGDQGRAVAAYQAALQSNPGYGKAAEALERLGVPAAAAPPAAAPSTFPAFGAPASPSMGAAPAAFSPQPQPGFQPGQPLSGPTMVSPGQPYAAPQPGFQPYGAQPVGAPGQQPWGLAGVGMTQPSIISSVRFWYMFQIVIICLVLVFGLLAVSGGHNSGGDVFGGIAVMIVYGFSLVVLIAAYILAGRRTTAGYYIVLVLSIIGILAFPIGTIISVYILTKWFNPDLKAWYGVS